MRLRGRLAPALVLLPLLAGCAGPTGIKTELRAYITATERLARQFSYVDTLAGTTIAVHGAIADDYRYRVAVSVDGKPAYEDVVSDDARAARIEDPRWISRLTVPGQGVPAALQQGSWVVDRAGASSFQAPGQADPELNALTVLSNLSSAIDRAAGIRAFNPNASTYDPAADPFPHPSTQQTRYDVLPSPLPARRQAGTAQPPTSLTMANFRRIAVYVQDGTVRAIRESVDIASVLTDPQQDLIGVLSDQGIRVPQGSVAAQLRAIVAALNSPRALAGGQEPIQPDSLVVTFTQLGVRQTVTLPDGAVAASLAVLTPRGQVLRQPPP